MGGLRSTRRRLELTFPPRAGGKVDLSAPLAWTSLRPPMPTKAALHLLENTYSVMHHVRAKARAPFRLGLRAEKQRHDSDERTAQGEGGYRPLGKDVVRAPFHAFVA